MCSVFQARWEIMGTESVGVSPLIHPVLHNSAAEDSNAYLTIPFIISLSLLMIPIWSPLNSKAADQWLPWALSQLQNWDKAHSTEQPNVRAGSEAAAPPALAPLQGWRWAWAAWGVLLLSPLYGEKPRKDFYKLSQMQLLSCPSLSALQQGFSRLCLAPEEGNTALYSLHTLTLIRGPCTI